MTTDAPLPLVCRDVSFSYRHGKKAHPVLEHLNLELRPGEMVCLLGPSGCGKTTLVNQIIGTQVPTSGSVRVFGEVAPYRHARYRVGFTPQDIALYEDLSALENLEFFGSLYGMHGRSLKQRALELLELFSLANDAKKAVRAFSGGMKRRVSLACALLHDPDLLVLDEPTVGLDPRQRLTIWDHFDALQRAGKTLIITTHVMDEAQRCPEVAMLGDGHILLKDSPAQIQRQTQTSNLEAAFLVLIGDRSGAEELTAQNQREQAAVRQPVADGQA